MAKVYEPIEIPDYAEDEFRQEEEIDPRSDPLVDLVLASEDQTAEIRDAASPEEESPLFPIVVRADLPFEVKLDLAAQFKEMDVTSLDAADAFFSRGRLVKAALMQTYGERSIEAEYWGDLVNEVQSLAGAQNDDPPPVTLEEFESLSIGPSEADEMIIEV